MSKQLDKVLNAIIIVGIIYLAFVVITNMYNGQNRNVNNGNISHNYSSNSSLISKKIHSPISIFNRSSVKPINMSMATDQDILLIKLINESEKIITNDTIMAAQQAQNNNSANLGIMGTTLKNDANKYLVQINKINVSSQFKILYDEYKSYLDDSYQTGKYLESGTKNPLSSDIDIATEKAQSAFEHLNNSHYILNLKAK